MAQIAKATFERHPRNRGLQFRLRQHSVRAPQPKLFEKSHGRIATGVLEVLEETASAHVRYDSKRCDRNRPSPVRLDIFFRPTHLTRGDSFIRPIEHVTVVM